MTRNFESGPARRGRTIVTIGAVGYSGAGKTYSLLRIASGMQDAIGGKTVLVDSNLRRSLYYAPNPGEQPVRGQTFDFEVVHFTPPFGPMDCRAVFEHALKIGATRIIWDCASDEWEGEGGVLDAHDRAIDEMIDRKRDQGNNEPEWKLRERLSDVAWIKVKRDHLALRLWMWQQPVDWLLSFRAKQKIDRAKRSADGKAAPGKGKPDRDDQERSWQPIGANELVYDLMLRCLLPPSSDGTPIWNPATDAERLLVKPPPGPIRELLKAHPQINEELGYQIARWATGHDIEIRGSGAERGPSPSATSSPRTLPTPPAQLLIDGFSACSTPERLEQLKAEMKAVWESVPKGEARTRVTNAFKAAEERVDAQMSTGGGPPT